MTPLRQKMIEDMQLRGLSERTQVAYVAAVCQLAEHYGKSPDQIKVRYYGLFSPSHRPQLNQARQVLGDQVVVPPPQDDQAKREAMLELDPPAIPQDRPLPCPRCGRPMRLIETLKATRCRSP